MATVDIEPAALAVTPGESQVLTLTVRNDGDEVEAYRLKAVDDAADHVVIEPDTLLVHPGNTRTATATLTLKHPERWSLGDLIVRFHIVPAEHPDEFLVVEAIATIQSFSRVAAVLTQPALDGRRSAKEEIAITNAGNVHSAADLSVSAGELAVSLDESRAEVPAGATENVGLTVRARSLLWRGEPVQHPFVVTVTPEREQAITLDGTFTQHPVFAKWAFVAAIAVAAAAAVALMVWVGAAVLSGVRGAPAATTASATPSPTPLPEPDVRMVVATTTDAAEQAGDPVALTLQPDVDGAPDDSLLAVEVEWPEGLVLAVDECEAWVAPDTDAVLAGAPRSGDECIIDLSRARNDAELTFTTPPAGFTGAVNAGATRLVTLESDEVTTLETGPDADFGVVAAAEIELAPYPFWLEVVDADPSDGEPDAKVIIHRLMRGDGTDEAATMAFHLVPPEFVDGIAHTEGCDSFEDSTCSVNFFSDPDDPTNSLWEVDVWFDPDDARGIGPLIATGTSLTDVAPDDVSRFIRSAEGLVVIERMFSVDVRLDSDEDEGQGETVTATIDVTPIELPADGNPYSEGSWELALELEWPDGLAPVGTAMGCTLVGQTCTLPSLDPGEAATITMAFNVVDPFDGGDVRASGATLSFDPTTAADERDGREQPAVILPPHWIGTDAEFWPE